MSDKKLNIPYREDPAPKPAPPKLLSPGELGVIMPEEGMGGIRQPYQFKDFDFVPKPGMDNQLYRAQRQKWYEELGVTIGNLLPNIGLGLVEGVGYIGTLFEFGDDRDYSNALTELAQKYKNPFGEAYREDPSKLIDWKDSAWWFNTGGQLAESIGEFALLGMGTGSIFSKLAKGAAWSAQSLKVASGAAQVLNAGLLSYVEGAMSGQQIYQKTYQSKYEEMLRDGATHVEADEAARKISAEAAARTVQLNTIMNTGLNLTILGPMFRGEENAMMKWFRNNKQRSGESLADYKARLQQAVATDPAIRNEIGLRHKYMALVGEPLQEGLEEINTQYAEQASGKKQSLMEALTDFESYLKAVTNEEGALNFALGALGGLGHTAVIDNVPVYHKNIAGFNLEGKALDKSGKTTEQKRWVSARTLNEYNTRSYFNNVKDALIKDINWFEQKNKEMEAARQAGDSVRQEQVRSEMIAVNHFNAVTMGLAENWKEQYRQIAALDNTKTLDEPVKKQLEELEGQLAQATAQKNEEAIAALTEKKKELMKLSLDLQDVTEAIRQGYAEHIGDTRYQQRATEAIQDLEYLQRTFDDLQALYNTGNQEDADLVDHLFYRKANHYLTGKSIEKQELELERLRTAWRNQNPLGGLRSELSDKYKKLEDLKKVRQKLEAQLAMLRSNEEKQLRKLLEQYKVTWIPGESVEAPVKRLVDAFTARSQEYARRQTELSKELEDAVELWKAENPGVDNKELETRLGAYDTSLGSFIDIRETQLEQVKQEHALAGEFLQEMTKKPNLEQFRKATKEDREKGNKEYRNSMKEASDRILQEKMDKEAAEELLRYTENKVQQDSRTRTLEQQRAMIQERIRAAISTMKVTRNKEKKAELRDHIAVLRSFQSALTAQLTPAAPVQRKVDAQEEIRELVEDKPKPAKQGPKLSFNTVPKEQTYGVLVAHLGSEAAAEWMMYLKRNRNAPFDLLVQSFRNAYEQVVGKPTEKDVLEGFFIPFLKYEIQQLLKNPPTATENYTELRDSMVKPVQDLLDEYETGVLDFDATAILGKLKEMVSPESAINLVSSLQAMLEERGELTIQSNPEQSPETPIAPVVLPEQGNVINYTLLETDSDTAQELHKNHTGKTVRDAMKVGYNSTPYDELQFSNNYGYLRYFDVLDENFNKENLLPGAIVPGTRILFKVDTKWSGQINIDNALVADEFGTPVKRADSFQNYVDSEGKVPVQPSSVHPEGAYANVPIQIINAATGQVLGYVHRVDWVTSKYPGSSTYQHILDSYTEGEQLVTNNVAAQARRLKALRRAIVESFNKGAGPLESEVTERSSGSLFLNLDINKSTEKSKLARASAATLLPDPNLRIGYVAGTPGAVTVNVGANTAFEGTIVNMAQVSARFAGVPVTLHPTPSGYIAAPLFNRRLGDIPVVLNTVVAALEIYLGGNKEMAATVLEKTRTEDHPGFDLLTAKGLREFLNQFYLNTTRFSIKETRANPSSSDNAVERFVLDVEAPLAGETQGRVKVGETFSGTDPIYLKVDGSGKLMADQIDWLRSHLSSQYFVVPYTRGNIRGLNHPGKLAEVQIRKDGTVHRIEHANFNGYLKSKSETYVYGKHQVNGQYVYTANPAIYFDYAKVFAAKPPVPPANTQTTTSEEDDLDFFGSIRNGLIQEYSASSAQPTALPEKGVNLSRELLENISNFTPEEHHNGKSVENVLQELMAKGIHTLAEGHNPFYKC